MTIARVAETSVTFNNNSPFEDYVHQDDQTQPTFEMTPGFNLSQKCLITSQKRKQCAMQPGSWWTDSSISQKCFLSLQIISLYIQWIVIIEDNNN